MSEARFPRPLPEVWPPGPVNPVAREDEVHVWLGRLEAGFYPGDLHQLQSTLDEGERRRAGRFRHERDRVAYVISHGLLRMVLGRYVGRGAGELVFGTGRGGKPELVEAEVVSRQSSVRFSMSHSGEVCMIAVACGQDVGVDVERVREDFALGDVSEQSLSAREAQWLGGLEAAKRREAFFVLWTCKEACLKASGLGLAFPPKRVDVRLDERLLLPTGAVTVGGADWELRRLPAPHGYAAAVAMGCPCASLRLWTVVRR